MSDLIVQNFCFYMCYVWNALKSNKIPVWLLGKNTPSSHFTRSGILPATLTDCHRLKRQSSFCIIIHENSVNQRRKCESAPPGDDCMRSLTDDHGIVCPMQTHINSHTRKTYTNTHTHTHTNKHTQTHAHTGTHMHTKTHTHTQRYTQA